MLTISPPPEAEQWIHSQAQQLGIAAEELAGRMFSEMVAAKAATDDAETARLAAIDELMGMGTDVNFSTEDLTRDEAQLQRQFGRVES